MKPLLRDIESTDFASILQINRQSIPAVSELDPGEITRLLGLCEYAKVIELNGKSVGYVFALRQGLGYDGEEYRWFCENIDEGFLYIDQVAIAAAWQGQGHGKALYRDLESYALQNHLPALACEVNVKPLNRDSLAFHRKLKFEELAQMQARGMIVSLLAKRGLRANG